VSGYVKVIVHKTSVISFDELALRIVAAVGSVTRQTLENPWRKIEYGLDI
jgi:ATP-dependent helicase/DNAse subunit B